MDTENLLPKEQKGCSSGTKGCKDQLLISKVILREYKSRKKSLSMAWIDYQKAFDRVPHSWIIKSQFDAGEIPRRKYTIFKSQQKSEIKKIPRVNWD